MITPANDPRFDDLRAAYRAAAARAERPESTAADHAAWLAAQSAYYKAGGRDPADGWPSAARERLSAARAAIAKERGIPEAEVHGWEAGFRAWAVSP